jgi:hypothetical protein
MFAFSHGRHATKLLTSSDHYYFSLQLLVARMVQQIQIPLKNFFEFFFTVQQGSAHGLYNGEEGEYR